MMRQWFKTQNWIIAMKPALYIWNMLCTRFLIKSNFMRIPRNASEKKIRRSWCLWFNQNESQRRVTRNHFLIAKLCIIFQNRMNNATGGKLMSSRYLAWLIFSDKQILQVKFPRIEHIFFCFVNKIHKIYVILMINPIEYINCMRKLLMIIGR